MNTAVLDFGTIRYGVELLTVRQLGPRAAIKVFSSENANPGRSCRLKYGPDQFEAVVFDAIPLGRNFVIELRCSGDASRLLQAA